MNNETKNELMNTLLNSGVGNTISGTHWMNGHFSGVISDVRVKYGNSLEVIVEDVWDYFPFSAVIDSEDFFSNDFSNGCYTDLELGEVQLNFNDL